MTTGMRRGPRGTDLTNAYLHFKVVLGSLEEINDTLVENLFAAGCDDGSPWSSQGVAGVHFDREADSLEQAIRSAVADVQAAGYRVARVEIEPADLAITAPAAKGGA